MKRFLKLLLISIATVFCAFSLCGVAACGRADIRQVELSLKVYDINASALKDYTLTVDLYRHLAPKTCDAILDYVKDGYYDNTVFYKNTSGTAPSKIMLGEFKYDSVIGLYRNAVKPTVPGEYKNAGTIGSNLIHQKGVVGLWRSWYANDNYTTSNASNTGRSTWYMPVDDTLSSLNDYFCLFAKIEGLDDADSQNYAAFEAIRSIINSSNTSYYDLYEVYYTGTYDESKPNEDYGLTFNKIEADQFNEQSIDGLFKAEGRQLVCYNHYTLKVPASSTQTYSMAQVVKAKVK